MAFVSDAIATRPSAPARRPRVGATGRRRVVTLVVVAVVALVGVELLAGSVRDGHRRAAQDALAALADTDVGAYERWFEARSDGLVSEVRHDDVVSVLRAAVDGDAQAVAEVPGRFTDYLARNGDVGVLLLDEDGTVTAATDSAAIGRRTVLRPLLGRSLSQVPGPTRLVLDRQLLGREPPVPGAQPYLLGIAVELDETIGLPGTLILQLDAAGPFSEVAVSGRTGRTGETYIVGPEGFMLTPSRFQYRAEASGLVRDGVQAAGQLRLVDPGRPVGEDQPATPEELDGMLTNAAAALVGGQSGEGLTAYRNYLGRRVIGAWRYSPLLGLGLVTEVDEDEVLAPARPTVLLLRGGFLGLMVLAGGLLLVSERAARADREREASHRLAAELEAQVVERTAELRSAVDLRDELLRSVSHELRTPLTILRGLSETTYTYSDRLEPERIRAMGEVAMRQSRRLTELIEDLTDADRLLSGTVRAHPRPVALGGLVTACVDHADIRSHGVLVDLPSTEVWAMVDAPKVERMLTCMLDNAVNHTPVGTTITVVLRASGDEVLLRVDDEGDGICPTIREAVLEPFRHGPERVDAANPGLGLGLTLVAEFARLHGGSVELADAPNGGASVRATLPWVRPDVDVDDPSPLSLVLAVPDVGSRTAATATRRP